MDILAELNDKEYYKEIFMKYDIGFCHISEVEKLVKFIDNHWRKDHIFVKSRELLDWQHLDRNNDRYNFVIAKSKTDDEIHAILGFIPTSQFDDTIDTYEVWPCIWKVREDIRMKGLGSTLYYYLKETINIETISILGISDIALNIYKYWGFITGRADQYYLINDDIESHKLVKGYDGKEADIGEHKQRHVQLNICNLDSFLMLNDELFRTMRYKTKEYYVNRFYRHPIYKYQLYSIEKSDEVKAILVMRVCEAKGAKAIRIVDYIGDEEAIGECNSELKLLMKEMRAEYIDFLNVGFNAQPLLAAGFKRNTDDEIVIPNYYEPFLPQNVELDYAFKTIVGRPKLKIYKADADQDRPNLI